MPISLDCLILGGGIAGLWTLRTLLAEGYEAVLVETNALGTGQTIASQGILHAGTKYALTGQAVQASKVASRAAAIWRDCLQSSSEPRPSAGGATFPDLSTTKVLSSHTYLFTTPGLPSRLAALAASKALTIAPQKLSSSDFPSAFADAPPGIDLYQLEEPVLDIPSLLETLAAPVRDHLVHARKVELSWDQFSGGGSPLEEKCSNHARKTIVTLTLDSGVLAFRPRVLVCAAGSGNEALLAQLDLAVDMPMQRRSLHMTAARPSRAENRAALPRLFAHCVSLSDKPRMTITTPTDALGRCVWLLGGQLAETGVTRSGREQVAAAGAELAKILPWLDLDGLEFMTFRIDRAEGAHSGGRRPDTPVVRRVESVIACWPTKLVLAPLAALEVFAHLRDCHIKPSGKSTSDFSSFSFSFPGIALPPWDDEEVVWS